MPIARFQLPDGRVARFYVPEGTTPEQAQAQIEQHLSTVPDNVALKEERQPDIAERIAGNPVTRFALGAASPILGAAQLGAEALGFEGVTEHLKQLEEIKRRGMGKDAGFDWAGLAGTVLSPAVLGAMKIPTAASFLGRVGQGAAIGAGFGAATPVTEGDSFWSSKAAQTGTGAAIGGIIPPVIEGTGKVLSVARNIVDPLLPGGSERGAARIMAEAAGPKRAAIEAELAKNQILVPGSRPTAAEAAARAGSPEFSALQQIAREHKPSQYSDIAKAQEAARLASVRSVGQTPTELKAAESVRAISGKQNYGAVVDDMIATTDNKITALLERPSMKEALKRASSLAKEGGKSFGNAEDGFTIGNLQSVKMALDDLVKNPERFGIGASEVNAIQKTRFEFVNWLSKQSPKWERARIVYANQSKPINEMQVGQELERALTKPIGEGERLGVFAGAVREAPRTIKKATGQPRFEELDEVLQPQNLDKVKGVLADLARKAESDRLAPLGRGKAAEAAQPFGLPATGPLHQSYMIFKTVLGRVSKGINEKTLDTMAEALELPASSLKLLQRAPTAKQAQLINQIIAMKLGRGAIAAGAAMSGEGVQ